MISPTNYLEQTLKGREHRGFAMCRNLYGATAIVFVSLFFLASEGFTETYEYDSLDRLIRVVHDDGSTIDYSYDDAGNIVAQTIGEGSEGEGEGEGPRPVCSAIWIDGVPSSGGVGDIALLTFVVGAMLFYRGRRTTDL